MLSLNGLRATSVRLVIPYQGAWIADVDFDLAAVPVLPEGPAVLTVGQGSTLVGFIDEDFSGGFANVSGRARVIAGRGGWRKDVVPIHFHNDAGVLSSAVIAATAAEVGELATDLVPTRLGVDYSRAAGPAYRVLTGRDWFVDFTGMTVVGPRPPVPAPPTATVLTYDPGTQTAILACDEPLVPGTVLVDQRFGTVTVRDVEITFADEGIRASVHLSTEAKSRFSSALGDVVREAAGVVYLKAYRYRVVGQNVDGRVILQAVHRTAGIPDALPLSLWPGMSGLAAKLLPGSEAVVEFLEGDPAQPIVRSFDGQSVPLELSLNAVRVKVGAGASPAVLYAPLLAYLTALEARLAANVPPIPVPTPFALAGAASTKLFSD